MHCYDICESSDGLSLRYVCMYVAATVPVSKAKAKAKMDIHVVDSGFGAVHSDIRLAGSAGRAGERACGVVPLPPARRRRFEEGRT